MSDVFAEQKIIWYDASVVLPDRYAPVLVATRYKASGYYVYSSEYAYLTYDGDEVIWYQDDNAEPLPSAIEILAWTDITIEARHGSLESFKQYLNGGMKVDYDVVEWEDGKDFANC